MKKNTLKGFTLIELLVVIGILAILLAITLIAINPARQFAQSNNTKRSSDVNAILNAINQYMADYKGVLPPGINTTASIISSANGFGALCTALVPTYIAALPVDPTVNTGTPVQATDCASTTAWSTNYRVVQLAGGGNRITVDAPGAELGATIQVTR